MPRPKKVKAEITEKPVRLTIEKKKEVEPEPEPEVAPEPVDPVDHIQVSDFKGKRTKYLKDLLDKNEETEAIVTKMKLLDAKFQEGDMNAVDEILNPKPTQAVFKELSQEEQCRISINRYMTKKNYEKRFSPAEVDEKMRIYDQKALIKAAKKLSNLK
mgnify:CR=1 FL=1